MKRKFNYTGRKRIDREKISIKLIKRDNIIESFNLEKLDIADLNLPKNAKIYVEAYYRTELKRFEFGTVENLVIPPSLSLTGLAYPENLKFRVLIVDPSDGKILAHAAGITPEAPAEKKTILPVEFRDLGKEIWRVEYEGDEGSPILCLNSKIPNIQHIAKTDPQFITFVYPSVIREILTHMVFIDEVTSVQEPSVDWHHYWLKFSIDLGAIPPLILNHKGSDFDQNDVIDWINRVVKAFCDTHGQFDEYVKKLEESS